MKALELHWLSTFEMKWFYSSPAKFLSSKEGEVKNCSAEAIATALIIDIHSSITCPCQETPQNRQQYQWQKHTDCSPSLFRQMHNDRFN